jgi:hypothetical protein
MNPPESFTPALLLNIDSTKSPNWPAATKTSETAIPENHENGKSKAIFANAPNSDPMIKPPIDPATVLLGLIAGYSFKPPMERPI